MKIPAPEIPEPYFDEFGDEVVRPIIIEEGVRDGVKYQVVENLAEWNAYEKERARKRDAAMLERGEIDQEGLRRKNGFISGHDISKMRIVAVGNRKWEDID